MVPAGVLADEGRDLACCSRKRRSQVWGSCVVAEQPDILGSLSPAVSWAPHLMPQPHCDHLKSCDSGLARGFQLTAQLQEFVVIACSLMLRDQAMPFFFFLQKFYYFFKGRIRYIFLFLNLFF